MKQAADPHRVLLDSLRMAIAVAEDELQRPCCKRSEFLTAYKDRCRGRLAEVEGK